MLMLSCCLPCSGEDPQNLRFLHEELVRDQLCDGQHVDDWLSATEAAECEAADFSSLFSETSPAIQFRTRFDVDAIWVQQDARNTATFGDISDVVGVRRAWVGLSGQFSTKTRYTSIVDLSTGEVVPRDLFISRGTSATGGELRLGHFREPFSLEGGTASTTLPFLERSPVNQFDPARSWGVGYFLCNHEEDMTWAIGGFHSGTDTFNWNSGAGSTSAITTRWTMLPWSTADGKRFWHCGLALSTRIPEQKVVIINQQAGSPLLDAGDAPSSPFISGIRIPAEFQQLGNLQTAYVDGPFSMQTEWYGNWISQTDGPGIFMHGGYFQVGYFLTGEQRQYQRTSGQFGAVSVARPVLRPLCSQGKDWTRGPGAWELAARVSYFDDFDGDSPTGPGGEKLGLRMLQFSCGVNWYLADHLRMMFNYTFASPNEPNTGTSRASLFSTRLGLFW